MESDATRNLTGKVTSDCANYEKTHRPNLLKRKWVLKTQINNFSKVDRIGSDSDKQSLITIFKVTVSI